MLRRHWREGTACVAWLHWAGWVRAEVVKEEMGMVKLFLIDYGLTESVAVESIHPLSTKFNMAAYSWIVRLTKLRPAGGIETWSMVACEKLQATLEKTNMEVLIEVVGKMDDSWPVVMFINERDESAGPLDPDQFIIKSVGDILIDEGLAFLSAEAVLGLVNCGDGGGGDIDDQGVESFVQTVALEVIDGLLDAMFEVSGFQWIKAIPPTITEFDCSVSHIDWDCRLYISTIPDNKDQLRIIGSVLDFKYRGSFPSPEDLQWSVGQACIAQFCAEKKWYRGEVLEVKDTGKCLVKFVDYGSEELCNPYNLRKDLLLTNLPVQCFIVQMDKVIPILDKWEEPVLNFLHKTVADQLMRVNVFQFRKTFPIPVKMFTRDGLDIGKMLVRNGYAREREENIVS